MIKIARYIFLFLAFISSVKLSAQGESIPWAGENLLTEISESGYYNEGSEGWDDGYLESESRSLQVGLSTYELRTEDYESWVEVPFRIGFSNTAVLDDAVTVLYFDGANLIHNGAEVLSYSSFNTLKIVLNHLGNVEVYNGTSLIYSINSVLVNTQQYYVYLNLLNQESFLSGTFTELISSSTTANGSQTLNSVCSSLSSEKYVEEIAYDRNGQVISHQLQVLGDFNKPEMAMQKNLEQNEVLGQLTLYDHLGRPVVKSLEAPMGQTDFCKDNTFMYSVDQDPVSNPSAVQAYSISDALNSNGIPDAVSEQSILGNFYNGFTDDISKSEYPFVFQYYKDDIYSDAISSGGLDQKFFEANNRSFVVPAIAANEISNVYGAGLSHYKESDPLGGDNSQMSQISTASQLVNKVINITKEDEAVILYNSLDGEVLATAISGNGQSPCAVQDSRLELYPGVLTTVHVPDGYASSLYLDMPDPTLIFTDQSVPYPIANFDIKIVDQLSGFVLQEGTDYNIVENQQSTVIQSIQLLGSYSSGQQVLGISVDPNEDALTYPAWKDYFSVIKTGGLKTFINYQLDYHDWTLHYYDVLGNLLEVVQPEGIDCTVDASNYYQTSQRLTHIAKGDLNQTVDIIEFPIAVPSGNTITKAALNINPNWVVEDDPLVGGFGANGDPIAISHDMFTYQEPLQTGGPPNPVYIGTAEMYAEWNSPGAEDNQANTPVLGKQKPGPPPAGAQLVIDSYDTKFTFEVIGRPAVGSDVVLLTKTFKILRSEKAYYSAATVGGNSDFLFKEGETQIYRYDNSGQVQLDWKDNLKFDDGDVSSATLSNYKSIVIRMKDVFYKEWRSQDDLDPTNATSKPSTYTPITYFSFGGGLGVQIDTRPSAPSHNSDLSEYYSTNHQTGSLVRQDLPDQGLTEYLYDKKGNLKFSRNATQAANNTFSYVLYDSWGRVLEMGEYDNTVSGGQSITFGVADPNNASASHTYNLTESNSSLNALNCQSQHYSRYNTPSNDYPASLTGTLGDQNFTEGRLVKTWNENTETWYSYDYLGRLEHLVQESSDLGVHTIRYTYDHLGKIVAIAYDEQNANRDYYLKFSFNKNQELTRIIGSDEPNANFKLLASYEYDILGRITRKEMGNKAQGVDYYYTISGKLKGINNAFRPELDQDYNNADAYEDLFAETLHYYEGDYRNANVALNSIASSSLDDRLDGTIKAATWHSRDDIALTVDLGNRPTSYYSYDVLGQLTGVDIGNIGSGIEFGYTNSSPATYVANSALPYQTSYSYDGNGNISTLSRRNGAGIVFDQLTYHYPQNSSNELSSNKLLYVGDASSSSSISDEITNQASNNYQYDSRGQLIVDLDRDVSMTYTPGGKVASIYNAAGSQLRQKNYYDDRGNLYKKENYLAGVLSDVEYWINNLSGNAIHYFKEDVGSSMGVELKETYAYGDGRISTLEVGSEGYTYRYEVKDHIGNVRATLSESHVNVDQSDFTNLEHLNNWSIRQTAETGSEDYLDASGWHVEGENIELSKVLSLSAGAYSFSVSLTNSSEIDLAVSAYNAQGQLINSEILSSSNLSLSLGFKLATAQSCTLKVEAVGSLLTSFTVGELSLTKQSHQVLSYRDYYAYGWALPGRQYEAQSDGNQFQYQGDFAVFNDLMNWNRFQLRNLDTRIGRWLSIDPAGQYYSLYKAMGNNPISVFDPDGAWGYTDEDGNYYWFDNVEIQGNFSTDGPNGKTFTLESMDITAFYRIAFENGEEVDRRNYGAYEVMTPDGLFIGLGWGMIDGSSINFLSDEKYSAMLYQDMHYVEHPDYAGWPSPLVYVDNTSYFDYNGDGKVSDAEKAIGVIDVAMTIFDIVTFPSGEGVAFHQGLKQGAKKIGKEVAEEVAEEAVERGTKIVFKCSDDVAEFAGKGYCFTKGTLVLSNNGLIAIENIVVGDSVFSFSELENEVRMKSVQELFIRQTDELCVIYTNRKDSILTTKEHPFYVGNSWKNASDIDYGDTLTTFKDEITTVTHVQFIDSTVTVYNFAVEEFHSYYISQSLILVHNTCKIDLPSTKGADKGSISGTKSALEKAKKEIGLEPTETLSNRTQGKFGSPQRVEGKKGYRLDPAHPNAKPGSPEEYPHINFWDYTNGKRGKGGIEGAIPIFF